MMDIKTVFDDASMVAAIVDALVAGPCIAVLLLFVSFVAQNRAKKGS